MDLESVTFWLNAFIPNSVCQKKGDLFAISVDTPVARHFAGDQREFSKDPKASARTHAEVKIAGLTTDDPRIVHQQNVCGESLELDDDGNIIARATASNDRMRFFNLR